MKLNELPYKPLYDPKQIDRVKEIVEKAKENLGYVTNFAICYRNPKNEETTIQEFFSQGCHVKMATLCLEDLERSRAGKDPLYPQRDFIWTECGWWRPKGVSLSQIRGDKELVLRGIESRKELVKPFFDWFFNRSFIAPYILNRDDPEWVFNNGFIFSGDIPTTIMQSALIISRHFNEQSNNMFEMYNEMCKVTSEDLAYYLVFNSTLASGTSVLASYVTHRAFGLFGHIDNVGKFLAGDFGKTLGHTDTYRDRPSILGTIGLCDNVRTNFTDRDHLNKTNYGFVYDLCHNDPNFIERLKAHRHVIVEEVVIANPFTLRQPPSVRDPWVLNKTETFEVLIPFMNKVFNLSPARETTTEKELANV